MFKLSKRILSAAVSVLMLTSALAGCAGTAGQSSSGEAASSDASKSASGTHTVVDHAGNSIELPTQINRIVISSILPLPSVVALFDGASGKVVGMDPSSMAAAKNSILPKVHPEILNASTDFIKDGNLNIEEVIKLKPDVVFYSADKKADYEALTKAGIPAVGFSTSKFEFNSVKTFDNWVTLLGEVLGQTETAKKIADYGYEVEDEVTATIKAAGDSIKKPRVLILFRYENGAIKTSGSNFFGQFWLDTTGAENVAKDLKGIADINMEQIYQWNPDMIFITNFTPYQPEDLYSNSIEGFDWSKVKAVQDKKVYKFPLGMYRWFPPASDTPLSLKWLASKTQPELFKNVDMNKEVKEYYKRFYNYDLTEEELQQIFNPSSDGSGLKK